MKTASLRSTANRQCIQTLFFQGQFLNGTDLTTPPTQHLTHLRKVFTQNHKNILPALRRPKRLLNNSTGWLDENLQDQDHKLRNIHIFTRSFVIPNRHFGLSRQPSSLKSIGLPSEWTMFILLVTKLISNPIFCRKLHLHDILVSLDDKKTFHKMREIPSLRIDQL